MRVVVTASVVLLLVVVSVPGTAVATSAAPAPHATGPVAGVGDSVGTAEPRSQVTNGTPPDPPKDRIGWENGYWYNESIDVDPSDGLNESELDTVVARSMARVEHIRELEFNRTVPVSLISRATYRERYANASNSTVSSALRTFDNVKFEAMFLINETTDSIAVQRRNRGTVVGGFYSPGQQRIVVVSENATSPKLSEVVLAQELFHALQDQRFNTSRYNQSTRERHNAIDGLIEGDGNLVDYLYEQRCEAEWDCLRDTGGGGGGGELANIGTYLLKFQPYSDGPKFVRQVRQDGGWEAVNELYENPPASTEQVIHPEKYPFDTPQNVTVPDRTAGSWERVRPPGRPDYAEVGEAGLATMFVYPTYESRGRTQIVPISRWLNRTEDGNLSEIDPLNYANQYAAGWDGDQLAVYRNAANETGYVWRLAWDSPGEAREFLDGYRQVLSFQGAEQLDDRTYVIRDGGFADAFGIRIEGATVTIVNAPTVEQLPAVHTPIAPAIDGTTTEPPSTTTAVGSVSTARTGSPTTAPTTDGSTAPPVTATVTTASQPGFGVLTAGVAVLAGLVLLRLRRR